jgi:signal transduction histidine kinase
LLNIAASSVHLEKTLYNLVSNALKFSQNGTAITIECTTAPNNTIQIRVSDQGPGLTEEDKSKLFGKFMRLSARPTAGEHSTGLGLSIVKKLVEAMNGKVWCESTLGKGATFYVEFPKQIK